MLLTAGFHLTAFAVDVLVSRAANQRFACGLVTFVTSGNR